MRNFMGKSTVYFTDFRCKVGTSQLDKLKKLCIAAGIKNIDMDGKFVAIKMHFGELGNLAFLRPNYAKVVADLCKELGGMPFLTDCNTLYPGSRKNALEHMDCANLNGFNTITTGCQIIIGDGLRGTDDVEVPVENAEYCPTARIGRAVMDADIFISLTHFKGHEATGFGGAIKNIGMGCGSRAHNTFFIFDAVGLGLFTVVGIQKSIAVGYPMWVGIIMGTLTGAAGGMLRDVLLNEVPLIFRKDIYAIACICGGLIYYLCMYLDLPAAPTQFIAACSVILIRILAVRYGISLPALKGETRPAPKEK